jgi:FKBP-type peptidyl-prolyl cis-trans isomerase
MTTKMKRPAFLFLLTLLLTIILPACQENEWADWQIKNDQWLAQLKIDNQNDSTFHVSSSGLCYKVVYQGWKFNRRPNANSLVKVNYTGNLIDGSTFDSGTNAILSLSNVVSGWKEGIPKMNGGGIYLLYIPAKLGYDTVSTNVKIPPHSTLIFKVELIDSQN